MEMWAKWRKAVKNNLAKAERPGIEQQMIIIIINYLPQIYQKLAI